MSLYGYILSLSYNDNRSRYFVMLFCDFRDHVKIPTGNPTCSSKRLNQHPWHFRELGGLTGELKISSLMCHLRTATGQPEQFGTTDVGDEDRGSKSKRCYIRKYQCCYVNDVTLPGVVSFTALSPSYRLRPFRSTMGHRFPPCDPAYERFSHFPETWPELYAVDP